MHHTASFPPAGVAFVNLVSLHWVTSELTEFVLYRQPLPVPFEDIVRLRAFPCMGIAPPI